MSAVFFHQSIITGILSLDVKFYQQWRDSKLMSCNTGGGGMSEQLINLHPPAETLAGSVCWTRPRNNGRTGAGGQGSGLEKGVGSCREGQIKDQSNPGPELPARRTYAIQPPLTRSIRYSLYSQYFKAFQLEVRSADAVTHSVPSMEKKRTVTHLANWKMSKTNFSILIPFGLSGLIS